MFIELESLSSKRWLVNVFDIVLVEERYKFTSEEVRAIPMLATVKKCCTVIIRGRNETYWVKNSYKRMKKILTQNETRRKISSKD